MQVNITQEQRELRDNLIDHESHLQIMCDWVEADTQRRRKQQEKIEWTGSFQFPKIGQRICVGPWFAPGTVATYGLKLINGVYEHAVWVKFDNGRFDKFSGKECKEMTEQDKTRIEANNEMAEKLEAAGKKVETQRKERRKKQVKGSHLLDNMLATVREAGLTVDEKSSFYKVTGTVKKRAVYVVKKGGRVDLSGFCFDHPAVTEITEDEAKKRHLGRVRGQLNFENDDDTVMDAFRQAVSQVTEDAATTETTTSTEASAE